MWNGSNGIPSTIDGINDFVQSRITKANEYYIYIYYIYMKCMWWSVLQRYRNLVISVMVVCCCCANSGIPAGRGRDHFVFGKLLSTVQNIFWISNFHTKCRITYTNEYWYDYYLIDTTAYATMIGFCLRESIGSEEPTRTNGVRVPIRHIFGSKCRHNKQQQ